MTDSTAPSSPTRRRLGGDVYLTDSPGGQGQLALDVGFEIPGWHPRRPGAIHRAPHPGTAVQWQERWFEIVGVEISRGAQSRTTYRLAPWDDAEVFRTTFELTPETCEALTRRHREQEARRRRANALALLPFLTGLLPKADQERLERDYGVAAERATLISASCLLLPSVLVLSVTGALVVGTDFGAYHLLARRLATFSPLALYLAIESYVRLRIAAGAGPLGSLPVVLPLTVWRALRGLFVPREELEKRLSAKAPPDPQGLLTARDRVRRDPRHPDRLIIVSRLPKDHWTANVTGIEYDGETYLLVEREARVTPDGPRHRFVLEKPEHDVLFRSFVRYRPEEVRDVYREQRRARDATWAETFSIFWGLLDTPIQERLSKLYRCEPETMTRRALVLTLLTGAALVLRSGARMADGVAGWMDGAWLLLGLVLLWETALRKSRLASGQVPASLLGVVFRPFARRFLRWE